MAFCSNCGAKNADGVRFCSECGKPIGTAEAHSAPMQNIFGMRTEDDVQNFFRNELGFKESYVKKYRKMITPLVRALMPNEVIVFAFVGAQNFSSRGGEMCGYAMTNVRMLISHPENTSLAINNAMKGRTTLRGVEAYTYDRIGNISYNKGLLMGTIMISFFDGSGTITVDKKWTEQVYQGISDAVFKFR